ncbi:putative WD40/YVTN repeat-like-containing domain superfamily [Helianthus annuus]|nr:putative WD40/YVTN repeat-like-containing domain superfamily [Helianthus annuus]
MSERFDSKWYGSKRFYLNGTGRNSSRRNGTGWNEEGSLWVPTLVILRLNRAALCVQWSPKGNKFVVGSGAKTLDASNHMYDKSNNYDCC